MIFCMTTRTCFCHWVSVSDEVLVRCQSTEGMCIKTWMMGARVNLHERLASHPPVSSIHRWRKEQGASRVDRRREARDAVAAQNSEEKREAAPSNALLGLPPEKQRNARRDDGDDGPEDAEEKDGQDESSQKVF